MESLTKHEGARLSNVRKSVSWIAELGRSRYSLSEFETWGPDGAIVFLLGVIARREREIEELEKGTTDGDGERYCELY